MSTPPSMSNGQFVWFELVTPDAASSISFYKSVIGWTAKPAGPPNHDYTILFAGQAGVGGLLELPPGNDAGVRPGWIGYIEVPDVGTALERLANAGGQVRGPVTDIAGSGRFALVSDPQGAPFALFHPQAQPSPATPPATLAPFTPGHVAWHELHAADWHTAFAFYAELFGWTRSEAIDLGPAGTYQTFDTGNGSGGGMMTRTDPAAAPSWLHYIAVEQIEPAVERVRQAGGAILMGPHQVPGGSWIAQCRDPHNTSFAVIAPPP